MSGTSVRAVTAVVMGASAGGVQALNELLPFLPTGLRPPVFVVVHLPRDKPSVLAEIFGRKCAVPVCEAEDKAPVEAGTVYFAPTNYHLLIEPGPALALSADDPVHHSRPSIDVLFESAAQHYKSNLLGIILTGANEDGAAGLAAIHDGGGITVVQNPDTAPSPQMIRAALKLRTGHQILTLSQIRAMLNELDTVH